MVSFVLVSLVALSTGLGRVQAQPCTATLDGSQFPFLVPEHAVWDVLLRSATAGQRPKLAISEAGIAGLLRDGREAIRVSSALRDAKGQFGAASAETAAANATVAARDSIHRTLSQSDLQSLEVWADEIRRGMQFTFPVPGRRSGGQSIFACPVSVDGRQHPELIPEDYYWEFYLRMMSSIAEKRRVGADTYDPLFLESLRRHHLPIPEPHIVILLTTATTAIADADAVRSQSQPGPEAEYAAGQVIRSARTALLRTIPPASSLVVSRVVAATRGGTLYDFPTGG